MANLTRSRGVTTSKHRLADAARLSATELRLSICHSSNPTTDLTPATDPTAPPHPNIWPDEPETEGYEAACKGLYKVMVATGLLVARACEGLTEGGQMATTKGVEELLASSSSSKARLLHYVSLSTFPGCSPETISVADVYPMIRSSPGKAPHSRLPHQASPRRKTRLTTPGAGLMSITPS